jgi:protein-S-isoprenylcysteine O-methyltransferase Ste14
VKILFILLIVVGVSFADVSAIDPVTYRARPVPRLVLPWAMRGVAMIMFGMITTTAFGQLRAMPRPPAVEVKQ